MKEPRILIDILIDYFQNSDEMLAVNIREHFGIKKGNIESCSNEQINKMIAKIFPEDMFLDDWIDNQDVMLALHISPRTLQTLRSNGTLPFSRIGNKLYYLRKDVENLLADNYTMIKIRDYGKHK